MDDSAACSIVMPLPTVFPQAISWPSADKRRAGQPDILSESVRAHHKFIVSIIAVSDRRGNIDEGCDLIYDIPLFQNAHIDVLLFRSGDAFYIRINFSGNGIVNFRFINIAHV